MNTTTTAPPHEHTAWLRSQVARRVAQIDALTDLPEHDLVVAPLGKHTAPGSREDRTCDRCRVYVPTGHDYYPFGVRPRVDICLCAGLCATCARLEGIA